MHVVAVNDLDSYVIFNPTKYGTRNSMSGYRIKEGSKLAFDKLNLEIITSHFGKHPCLLPFRHNALEPCADQDRQQCLLLSPTQPRRMKHETTTRGIA